MEVAALVRLGEPGRSRVSPPIMASPHDELFRRVLSDPAVAAAWLEGVLPTGLSRRIDWREIRRLPDTFVRDRGGVLRTDLLFRATLRFEPPDGRRVERPLYLIPEHVSSRRRTTILQTLHYVLVVLEAHRREFPADRDLPPVLVIVCHHGPRGAFPDIDLLDLFGLEGEPGSLLAPYLPQFRVLLDDLAVQDPGSVAARDGPVALRLALLALQHAEQGSDPRSLLQVLRPTFEQSRDDATGTDGLLAVLVYAAQLWDLTPRAMRNLVAEVLGTKAERAMTSTYEQMLNEGRERGLAEGRAEGRAEGLALGRTELLVEQLETRFGPLETSARARLAAASEQQIRVWALRVLTADSLAEVLECGPA